MFLSVCGLGRVNSLNHAKDLDPGLFSISLKSGFIDLLTLTMLNNFKSAQVYGEVSSSRTQTIESLDLSGHWTPL